jgi:prepilin-type N-terminal cleavage/methylation domain-containing protein
MNARTERGFTVVELLAVMALTLVLLGLGATGLRHYWLVQSLDGAKSSLVSEMRAQQQKAASKSYPFVQGVWFVSGTPRWGTVELNAKTNTCTNTSSRTLDGSVRVASASFTVLAPHTATCRTAAGEAAAQIAFFYPGGTATQGTVALSSSQMASEPKTLTVSRLTGRVTE